MNHNLEHRKEISKAAISGWPMLFVNFCLVPIWLYALINIEKGGGPMVGLLIFMSLVGTFFPIGFFVNQPNFATAMTLFGEYKGTVRGDGFYWANPFFTKKKISLRAQTLNGQQLKVNDHVGNPVEIAAVIVWAVDDTYKALFEVENYGEFVAMQSETALRHLATSYPYDAEDDQISLMRNTDEIGDHLREELQQKLSLAGISVIEARLSHLAYAQEIAGVMLRKQQAAAIISARQRIVDGAVGMVEMALKRIEADGLVEMDTERKAQMVSNLMVVLCGETNAQPVINAGSLN
ncbi:MAG: SPFH domain-containing protein [Chthonomonas sp.]|nr:SPFH domain-containing protein [Chthonomonas sp.]